MMRSVWMWLVLVVATAGLASAAVTARVDDFTPKLIESGKETTVKITITNTGIQTDFRFVVDETPSGWTAADPTPSPRNIGGGKSGVFQMVVDPGLNEGIGQVKLTLYANNEFGDEVKVLQRSLTIESLAPPGDTYIQMPYVDEEVSVPFTISWTAAVGADTYALFVYERDDAGLPKDPPVFSLTGLVQTSYVYNRNDLQKGSEYLVWVFAVNRIANKGNVGGPRRILIKAAPALGAFDVATPSVGQVLSKRPVISWSSSANALSYTLNVLPEVDGVPVSDPVRTVGGITGTSYSWVDPPLVGGRNYYVTVAAVGEAPQPRFNTRGPVKFFASALEPFGLGAPNAGQENVNRETTFRWQRCEGAEYYKLKVERDRGDGTRGLIYDARVSQSPLDLSVEYVQPAGNVLTWGQRYFWSVVAYTSNEQRGSDSGERIFVTSNIRPFDLVAPASGATGVPVRPTFRWEGTNTDVAYFVQLTVPGTDGKPITNPVQNSQPIDGTEWTSTFAPLTNGATYFWRVGAFDAFNIEYSYGSWQKFVVTPITSSRFALLSPADGATNVSIEPILSWEKVKGAEGYVLYIRIPNVLDLDPIVVRGAEGFDFVDAGMHLNGEQTYEWSVVAFAGDQVLPASSSWVFTTEPRNQMTACDIADFLIGEQALGPSERAAGSLVGVIDAASYVRYGLLPENSPCTR